MQSKLMKQILTVSDLLSKVTPSTLQHLSESQNIGQIHLSVEYSKKKDF